MFLFPYNSGDTSTKIITLSSDGFRAFAKELETQKIIRSWRSLDVLSRLKNADKALKSGEYELSPSMTPKQILAKLLTGEIVKRPITIREGLTIWEIAKILEENEICKARDFQSAVTNRSLLAQMGILADSFEGYLFPETYLFNKNTSASSVILAMVELFNAKWTPEREKKANLLDKSKHEIITLASMIEKESGSNTAEQKMISSVFYNRLKINMRLQSDPTAVYLNPNFEGIIKDTDLNDPNAYNTYFITGLPPGPICNPGDKAIEAALSPEASQNLYFVADGKGGHTFSADLESHNIAVTKYREFRLRQQAQNVK